MADPNNLPDADTFFAPAAAAQPKPPGAPELLGAGDPSLPQAMPQPPVPANDRMGFPGDQVVPPPTVPVAPVAQQEPGLPDADQFFDAPGDAGRSAFGTAIDNKIRFGEGNVGTLTESFLKTTAIGRTLRAFGHGAAEGWGSQPIGLSDSTRKELEKLGVFNDISKGELNILKAFNSAILTPAAAAFDAGLRGLGAVIGGYQGYVTQLGEEVGGPGGRRLGRDLAGGIDQFAGSPSNALGGVTRRMVQMRIEADLAKARSLHVIGDTEGAYNGTRAPRELTPEERAENTRAAREESIKEQAEAEGTTPAKVAEEPGGAPAGTFETVPSEPPVPEGMVRLYHGGEPANDPGMSLWVTQSKNDAEGWAARGPEMGVWYVDVPKDHPFLAKYEGDLPNGIAPITRFELPPDLASGRKRIASAVADVDAPPAPNPPTVPEVARQMAPQLFDDYDALVRRQETYRRWLDELNETRARRLEADSGAAAEIARLEARMEDATPRLRKKYEARIAELEDVRREQVDEKLAGDSPEMARIRAELQKTDYQLRDLAPMISAAMREAHLTVGETAARAPEMEAPRAADVKAPEEGNRGQERATEGEAPAARPLAPAETAAAPGTPAELRTPNVTGQPLGAGEALSNPARPIAEQRAAIAADMRRQLEEAGTPPDQAEAQAALVAASYAARAERMGGALGTAEELYRAEGPRVVGKGDRARAQTAKEVEMAQRPRELFQGPDEIKGHPDGEREDKAWKKLEPQKTADGKYKGAPDWVDSPGKLGQMRKLLRQLVEEGIPGRFWYEDSARTIMRVVKNDVVEARKLIGLVALYSPQTPVFTNMNFAIKAYNQFMRGEPINVKTRFQDTTAEKWLRDGTDWGGRKTNSFNQNLMHEIVTSATKEELAKLPASEVADAKRATVDLWVLRAMGYDVDAAGSAGKAFGEDTSATNKYGFTENELRRLAGFLNEGVEPGAPRWLPHQVQAALWSSIKGRFELPSVKAKTAEESFKRGYAREEMNAETGKMEKVWPGKGDPNRSKHMGLWRDNALAAPADEVAKQIQDAKGSFADAINRVAQNVTWEAVPSTAVGAEINNAPEPVRRAFTRDALALIVDDTGADELARRLGVNLNYAETGTGAYAGGLNPNVVSTLVPEKPAGAFDATTANAYARAIQYIYKQDAVPLFRADAKADFDRNYIAVSDKGKKRFFPTPTAADEFIAAEAKKGRNWTAEQGNFERGVRINFGSELDEAAQTRLLQALEKELGPGAGYTKISPTEVVIINFKGEGGRPSVDDLSFAQALKRVVDGPGKEMGVRDVVEFGSEGNYGPVHDWAADPNGSGLSDGLPGGSDFQSWLRDRRAAFDDLVAEYAGDRLAERARELEREPDAFPRTEGLSREYGQAPVGTGAEGLPDAGSVRGGAQRLEASGAAAEADGGAPKPLRGLPRQVEIPGVGKVDVGPSRVIRDVADSYMREAGLPYDPPTDYVRVDPARAKRIADAYEAMPDDPTNPKVKAAYEAMAKETLAQWQAIKKTGLQVEYIDLAKGDPYAASPRLAIEDITKNNHMWVFRTDDGYGGTPITARDIEMNPMLAETGETIGGQPARVNDIFRIVHDYFGHAKEGVGFRADGEENAWRAHSAMYSPEARKAMTSETRGQNSWVNYGPEAERNKGASGADTVYAPQKIGLLPSWVMREGDGSALDSLRPLVDKADEALKGDAAEALNRFVGHEPGARDRGPAFGIMSSKMMEDIAKGKNPAAAEEIEKAFAPIREQLRERYGDSVTLFRVQTEVPNNRPKGLVNLSAPEPNRAVLSWTMDPEFAREYAGARKKMKRPYTEGEIQKAEATLEEKGSVKLQDGYELRRPEDPEAKTLDIYQRDEFITDTESVAAFMRDENEWRVQDIETNKERASQVMKAQVPLDNVVWVTDRAGQMEFIVRNDESLKPFIDSSGRSMDAGPAKYDPHGDRSLYQPSNLDQVRRGKIRLETGERPVITLFKDADASTMMHEFGHNRLEELMRDAAHGKAPEELKADWQTVRDWLGVKDDGKITVRMHEKWARGWERYLMEGVAPSRELAGVFEKFKNWLIDIYETVKKLNSPINDDIRRVMDRLITTGKEEPIIVPDEAPMSGRGFADIHEADANMATPATAATEAARIRTEVDAIARQVAPEVADELAGTGRTAGGAAQIERAGDGGAGSEPAGGAAGGTAQSGAVGEGGGAASGDGAGGGAKLKPAATGPGSEPPVSPTAQFEPPPSDLIDKAGNIRLDNLNTPESVNQVLREAAEQNGDFIEARRGVMSDAEVISLSEALGMDAGQLNARKIGEAFNAEQIVAARKLLVQSATTVRDLMARVRGGGTDADVLAYAQARERHLMIQEQVSGLTAEAGRALRAFRRLEGMEEAIELSQFLQEATGKTLNQMRIEASLGADLKTPQQVSRFVQDSKKPTFGDKVLEWWYASLFTGPITHLKNIAGNTIGLAIEIGEMTGAAGAGKLRNILTGTEDRVLIGQVQAGVYGMGRGAKEGVVAAWKALKSDEIASGPLKGEKRKGSAIGDVTVNVGGRELSVGGSTIRAPLRLLSSADAFFSAIGVRYQLHSASYAAAVVEGLKPGTDAFALRVAALTDEAATASQLEKKLLADPKYDSVRPMVEDAQRKAAYLTYQTQLGPTGRAVQMFANSHPLLKTIVPFVRTPLNIAKYNVERSPLGLFSQEVQADLKGANGAQARDVRIARLATGAMVGTAMFNLVAEGAVTGGGPTDPKEKAMLRLSGWQPYSVRIGENYYSYSWLPVGILMGMSADSYDMSMKMSEGEVGKATALLFASISKNLTNQTWLKGPSDVIEAIGDPDRYGQNYINGMLASLVPAGVGWLARTDDPYLRESRTLLDSFRARLPGLSEGLFPKRDIYGEPLLRTQPITDDPVTERMIALQIFPAKLSKQIRGVELNDQQYDDFQRVAGRLMRMRLDSLINTPGFDTIPPAAQIKTITNIVDNSREAARSLIMMQNPEIITKATDNKLYQIQTGKKKPEDRWW